MAKSAEIIAFYMSQPQRNYSFVVVGNLNLWTEKTWKKLRVTEEKATTTTAKKKKKLPTHICYKWFWMRRHMGHLLRHTVDGRVLATDSNPLGSRLTDISSHKHTKYHNSIWENFNAIWSISNDRSFIDDNEIFRWFSIQMGHLFAL